MKFNEDVKKQANIIFKIAIILAAIIFFIFIAKISIVIKVI